MANPIPPQPQPKYHPYFAWDSPTRWFHWINALGVIGLIATGPRHSQWGGVRPFGGGKDCVKSVHVWFGYVMAVISSVALCLGLFRQPICAMAGCAPGGRWLHDGFAGLCRVVLIR